MNGNQTPYIQALHQAATSINVALSLVALLLIGPYPTSALFDMDRVISWRLGLLDPHHSFTSGYLAFFVPAIPLIVCLFFFLRLSARSRLTRQFLRRGAGLAALVAPPVWLLCYTYAENRRYGWSPFEEFPVYEVLLVLAFGIIYLSGHWPISGSAVLIVLLLHYVFWFWQFGRHVYFMGYAGPLAPASGLCAGLTWMLYLHRQRGLKDVA